MDASPMPPEFVRELDALRRRAYGLDADIESDPVALRRLAELEAAAHSSLEHPPAPSPVGLLSAGATRALATTLVDAREPDELLDPLRHVAERPPVGRRWSTRRVAAIIAGIVALGWIASFVLIPHPDDTLAAARSSAQARQNLVDHVDLIAMGMLGARLDPFAGYGALSVWSATNESGTRCLLVGSGDSEFRSACAPAPLDPSLDLRVGDDVRPGLVGGLPTGSVIRFVLSGDDVGVWVAHAPSPGG
ncbi:hypothetical protein [Microbacterium rhizomatis]|uniref:Uncharacterized protein n=1 Tax=Microbacterium rhizomatis TaxID=1631477 RepID=A0A5J5IZW0_9MICO|nr:hypothetical protein [Microbacterium rhizomatis]KAA9106424.1 hypothetical protein F6B43_14840 [Microbacterium rhizomatis]